MSDKNPKPPGEFGGHKQDSFLPREKMTETDKEVFNNNLLLAQGMENWVKRKAKPLYLQILDKQKENSNEPSIESLKADILLSLLQEAFGQPDINFETAGLAAKVENRFAELSLSFKEMVNDLHHSVVMFCIKPTPKNFEDNSFRVSVSLNKIQNYRRILNSFITNS